MTNDALNEKHNKLDRLQLIALAGLMCLGAAFVFSATMASPFEMEKLWFAQVWFPATGWSTYHGPSSHKDHVHVSML